MTNYLYQLKINFKRIILRNKAFFFFRYDASNSFLYFIHKGSN